MRFSPSVSVILSLVILSSAGLAQSDSALAAPQCDATSVFSGVCTFFNFDLPLAVDTFRVSVGMADESVLAQDHVNRFVEKELEEVAVLDEFNSGQVDASMFQSVSDRLAIEEIQDTASIEDMAVGNPAAVDTDVLQEVKSSEGEITTAEQSDGAQVSDVAVSIDTSGAVSSDAGVSGDSGGGGEG